MHQHRVERGLLLGSSLLLAVVAQYFFARRPEHYVDAILIYLVAAVLFVLAFRKAQTAPAPAAERRALTREEKIRGALAGLGVLLALIVLVQLRQPRENYWPVFWLWLASMVLFVVAFAPFPVLPRRPGLRFRAEWAVVALLVAGALVLRAWRIDSIPWTVGGDEGSQGLWARSVLSGQLTNMFGTGWLSVPNLSFFWQAGWLRLAGDNVVGLRLPWAFVGSLTVLAVYLIVRRLFTRPLALATTLLLATYHFHIHYSRLGSNQIADALFPAWAIYFLLAGWQGKRPWAWAMSGVVAGLAFYFYAGSRQVPIILVALIAWAALTDRDFLREQRRSLLVMLGGFLVSVGPMALYFLTSPNDFNARLNAVGLFQSGLIDQIVAATGKSKLTILIEQVRQSFLAFNFTRDRVVWYGPDQPLLDFLASVLFVLGLAFSVSRLRQWRYGLFIIWFVLVIGMGGALTENPPSSQRIVSSAVPAVFFVAVALQQLVRGLRFISDTPRLVRWGAAAALLAFLSLTSLRYYFGPYQQSWVYGGLNAEVATRLGYYLRDLGPEYKEYFFGAPRMYADFGSTPFIARGIDFYDVKEPFNGSLDFVDPSKKPVFVFLPERLNEFAMVRSLAPGGIVEDVHRVDPEGQEPLLFTAYRLEQAP